MAVASKQPNFVITGNPQKYSLSTNQWLFRVAEAAPPLSSRLINQYLFIWFVFQTPPEVGLIKCIIYNELNYSSESMVN